MPSAPFPKASLRSSAAAPTRSSPISRATSRESSKANELVAQHLDKTAQQDPGPRRHNVQSRLLLAKIDDVLEDEQREPMHRRPRRQSCRRVAQGNADVFADQGGGFGKTGKIGAIGELRAEHQAQEPCVTRGETQI